MQSDLSRYYKRTIEKNTITSKYLNETRSLRIYLPPGYNELLSYPVIYCQDGEEFFNFGRIATFMTQGILDEGIEPAIIVGIDVNLVNRTSEYAPDGARHQAYVSFIAEELVPWVEQNYPARTDRDERILAGDSLGGTVSLHLALSYRDLFCKIISFSGAYFKTTRQALAAEQDLSWLQMFMIVGTDETEVATERGTFDFVQENRLTKEILVQKNTKLLYSEKPGKHIWGFWQTEMSNALHHFLG
jgi:enterochelin esterase-like enzyme